VKVKDLNIHKMGKTSSDRPFGENSDGTFGLLASESLIKTKQIMILPDEIPKEECEKLKEGAKKKIVVNAYERSYKARHICIEYYGCICVVCGFDFGKFFGKEFEGKIHVHHVIPLSEINDIYEVDPIKDLRPVCPNCHLALHSKFDGQVYNIDELKAKIIFPDVL